MKYYTFMLALSLGTLVTSGCATTVVTPTKLGDAVYYATDAVPLTASVYYETAVPDTAIRPIYLKKNGERYETGHTYNVQHNNALASMLKEYATVKFDEVADDGDIELKLKLEEVVLETRALDGGGKQFATVMFGGELQYLRSARQVATVSVTTPSGEVFEKTLVGSADTQDVEGWGTGTSTSSIYKGKQEPEMIFARLLNESSNRLILALDKYLDTILVAQ